MQTLTDVLSGIVMGMCGMSALDEWRRLRLRIHRQGVWHGLSGRAAQQFRSSLLLALVGVLNLCEQWEDLAGQSVSLAVVVAIVLWSCWLRPRWQRLRTRAQS